MYHAQLGEFMERDPVACRVVELSPRRPNGRRGTDYLHGESTVSFGDTTDDSACELRRQGYALRDPIGRVDPSGTTAVDWTMKLAEFSLPYAVGINASGIMQVTHFSFGSGSVAMFFSDSCEIGWFSIATGLARPWVELRLPKIDDIAPVHAGLGLQLGAATSLEAAVMFRRVNDRLASPRAGSANADAFAGVFYTLEGGSGPLAGGGYVGEKSGTANSYTFWVGGSVGGGAGAPSLGWTPWNYVKQGAFRLSNWCCMPIIVAGNFPAM